MKVRGPRNKGEASAEFIKASATGYGRELGSVSGGMPHSHSPNLCFEGLHLPELGKWIALRLL
jgi:hypothetical protein